MTAPRSRPQAETEYSERRPVSDGPSRDHGALVVVQERVLGDIAHELGNFFHKLYYWSDFIKNDGSGVRAPDSTVGHMLERTIVNLEEFLKVALEYFQPVTLDLADVPANLLLEGFLTHVGSLANGNAVEVSREETDEEERVRVDPTRLSQAFRMALRHVHEHVKAGGALAVSLGRSARHDRHGLEIRLDVVPTTPVSALLRASEVGIEWAVAQKLIELHGGEIAEDLDPHGRKVVRIFLPLHG